MPKKKSSSSSSTVSEFQYCDDVISYSSGTAVTSNAFFVARTISSSGLGGPTAPKPIRHAEVIVTDSAGTIVQCGETDGSGAISVQVPSTAGDYKISVNSRAINNYVQVSVLDAPSTKQYYSISAEFSVNGSGNAVVVSDMTAPYNGTLEGGAFNIMDQIYLANQFLRDNSTHTDCSGCTAFTVAPKSTVYWKKGFNPGSYFGIPEDVGLSLFSLETDPAARALYILGGIRGNTDNVDTDHFDNSVIIHEYGHFLENNFAETDSPGGSHNGNFIVDPRLAWGEGWANFFASAVQNNQFYRDTLGNSDGDQSYLLISFNLSATGGSRSGQDLPTVAGEGNFREISVSRSLWQIFHSTFANISFAFLWESFTNTTNGFKKSDLHFRSPGKFWTFLKGNVPASYLTNLNPVLSSELQDAETQDYARVLQTGSCSAISLKGVVDPVYEMTEYRQNLKRSNDFYQYTHPGGTLNLRLTYTQTGTPTTDLDLYVFYEDYSYDGASQERLATSDVGTYPEASGTGRQTISTALPAGTYLINVRAKTASWSSQLDEGATVNYQLDSNGVQLCPQ